MAYDTVKNRKTGKTYGPKEAKAAGTKLKDWKANLQKLSEKKMYKRLLVFSNSGETVVEAPVGVRSEKDKAAEAAKK